MPRHRPYRSSSNLQSVSSEWTSSQLVIGIAVAIVFGVVCFMFGYVIARYDRPIEPRDMMANTLPPVAAGVDAAAPVVVNPPKDERKRPRSADAPPPTVTTKPVETPAPAPAPAPAQKPADPTVQRPGIRATEIEPLPSLGQPTPLVKTSIPLNNKPEITTPAPVAATESPAPVTAPAPAPTTLSEPMSPAAPTLPETTVAANTKPPAPVTPPPVTPPAPKPNVTPPAPEAPVSRPPTVTRGSFGIQVAAFNGPKREEQAQESRKLLKSSTGKDAEIVHSSDGAYSKVVITGFPSREAAKAECEKIKTKPGYDAAWVIRLP